MKKVYLIGTGVGAEGMITLAAIKAVEESTLLLGAKRLLEMFPNADAEKKALILSKDIVEAIKETTAETISVLFSGDIGFYSGATALYEKMDGVEVISIPGISSLNYFCAKLNTPWQDVKLLSAHGRECNILGEIQTNKKVFMLTGGKKKAQDICSELTEAGLGNVSVSAGEKLSYPDERIVQGKASELAQIEFADLTVLMIENSETIPETCKVASISDEEFIRGKTPMTKEAVRTTAVSKLGLKADSTIWDVGAGTGSVSIACALSSNKGKVYAIEKKAEALELIQQNKEKFGVSNLHIVAGEAPSVLEVLPMPDSVFVGGSSGSMAAIFDVVLGKNPQAKIVVTAVSLESLIDGINCFQRAGIEPAIQQITAATSKVLGNYHMMAGENPVWILSGGHAE